MTDKKYRILELKPYLYALDEVKHKGKINVDKIIRMKNYADKYIETGDFRWWNCMVTIYEQHVLHQYQLLTGVIKHD